MNFDPAKQQDETQPNLNLKPTAFRRIIALIIDFIFLGVLGTILGYLFTSYFVQTSVHGILIGWLISTIYFTLSNSRIFSGQSIGKKMMSIEVINNNGEHLNFRDGLIRALLFTTPYFLLEYFQGLAFVPQIISNLLGALNIAYYVGLVYFFFINKQSHQTVHDIFSSTVVKHIEQNNDTISTTISRAKIYGYLAIVGFITISVISTALWFTSKTNLTDVFEANQEVLIQIAEEIYEIDDVLRVESSKIHVDVNNNAGVVIEAWTKNNFDDINPEIIYNDIVNILETKTLNINRIDFVEVVLKYGYDIGIADYTTTKEWKDENGK